LRDAILASPHAAPRVTPKDLRQALSEKQNLTSGSVALGEKSGIGKIGVAGGRKWKLTRNRSCELTINSSTLGKGPRLTPDL
jgi:hypothetical protein